MMQYPLAVMQSATQNYGQYAPGPGDYGAPGTATAQGATGVLGESLSNTGKQTTQMAPMAGPYAPLVVGAGMGMQQLGDIAKMYAAYKKQKQQESRQAETDRLAKEARQYSRADRASGYKRQGLSDYGSMADMALKYQQFLDSYNKPYNYTVR